MKRRTLIRTGALALVIASAACASRSTNDDDARSAIVGGTTSNISALVVVADELDRYACTGVVLHDDTVLVAADDACILHAAAVYVGFAAAVDRDDALAPVAGNATRIAPLAARASVATGQLAAGVLRASTAVTPVDVAAIPVVGATCEAVGYGPNGGSVAVGIQRRATMRVIAVEGDRVRTEPLNGSVALGDFDAFLFCGGKLVGPKISSEPAAASSASGATFAALSSPSRACPLNVAVAKVGGPSDASADANPDDCPHLECTPGQSETTTAGCASGARTRTCNSNGAWGRFDTRCQ